MSPGIPCPAPSDAGHADPASAMPVCPCEGDTDEPGPHLAACPWADPDYDPAAAETAPEPYRSCDVCDEPIASGAQASTAWAPAVVCLGCAATHEAEIAAALKGDEPPDTQPMTAFPGATGGEG